MKIRELFEYILCRKKTIGPAFFVTKLKRCLTTFDVTLLGTGHIIGAGIWIMSGKLVKSTGPSVIFSYLFCGILAFLASLPYAEFGGRIPKAGSVYSYGYITLGEFWAFLIGWDLTVENMLGAAALAVGWSKNLDAILKDYIEDQPKILIGDYGTESIITGRVDYIAGIVIAVICIFIMLGVKCSTLLNSIMSILSLLLIVVTVVTGLTFANGKLWTDAAYLEKQCGLGSNSTDLKNNAFTVTSNPFAPFGFGKVFEQCTMVFFAFIGFETVTSAGEEVKDCRKTMPRGILLAMAIVSVCFIFMIITLTLMTPYCLMPEYAPWANLFSKHGYHWAKYVAWAGAMCALTTVLYGFLFCLPRNVYALSLDGLLCKSLGYVYPKTQVPIRAVILLGSLSILPALFFTLEFLTEMVSIGTLTAYSIMACSIIVLRYRPDSNSISSTDMFNHESEENIGRLKPKFQFLTPIFGKMAPGSAAVLLTAVMVPFIIGFATIVRLQIFQIWSFITMGICLFVVLVCVFFLYAHQQSLAKELYFKVPFVPFLPALSLFMNILLMLQFPTNTWIRFGLWLIIGMVIYFGYGVYHSKENKGRVNLSIVPSISRNDNACLSLSIQPSVKSNRQPSVKSNRHQSIRSIQNRF